MYDVIVNGSTVFIAKEVIVKESRLGVVLDSGCVIVYHPMFIEDIVCMNREDTNND